jgi:hypothetical protein
MRRTALVTLVAVAAASFAAGASAQDAARWIGAVPSHRSLEEYEMSVGVTAGQLPRTPTKLKEEREVLHVPGHYGEFAGLTGDATTAVFWFRDAERALRNVVVHDAASRAVKLAVSATSRFEADQR